MTQVNETTGYCGRILPADFSPELKSRISELIACFRSLEETGIAVIPYISAWREPENRIWYEFAGMGLRALFGESCDDIPGAFKRSIIDRREYRLPKTGSGVYEDVIERSVLCGLRRTLREEGKQTGRVEAIYKMDPGDGRIIWMKDQARIETFRSDSVCLSPGLLFDVSKEMEAENELKRIEAALRAGEEKYRNLAIRDNLTGLFNTRHLYEDLSRRIAAGGRFSLIFMDMDDFKRVVDKHGHLSASRALQEVAGTIRETLDGPAYGVAYGGDEFVAVLPGFTKEAGMAKAEEIRTRIRETVYLSELGKNVRLSISCGVSAFPEEAADLTALLGRADRAMFDVKESGKDAVSGGA